MWRNVEQRQASKMMAAGKAKHGATRYNLVSDNYADLHS